MLQPAPKFESSTLLACVLAGLLAACATPPPPPPPVLEGATDIVLGVGYPLESEVLGETRTVNVCLPLGYDQRDEAFPVLYLIDGGVQQDLIPVAGFGALATLTAQYSEFIVVGIETRDRRFELTSPSTVPYDLWQIPRNGGAEQFRDFITAEVQPWIDQRYRTTGETAVLGESLAGLFIVDTFMHAPASFDHYIAVSPSLWWRDQALARSAAAIRVAHYMGCVWTLLRIFWLVPKPVRDGAYDLIAKHRHSLIGQKQCVVFPPEVKHRIMDDSVD